MGKGSDLGSVDAHRGLSQEGSDELVRVQHRLVCVCVDADVLKEVDDRPSSLLRLALVDDAAEVEEDWKAGVLLAPSWSCSADRLAGEASCHHIDGATLGCKVDQVHGVDLVDVLR